LSRPGLPPTTVIALFHDPHLYRYHAPPETGAIMQRREFLWHAANFAEEQVMFGPFSEGMRERGYIPPALLARTNEVIA
jgi:hypothetical protein